MKTRQRIQDRPAEAHLALHRVNINVFTTEVVVSDKAPYSFVISIQYIVFICSYTHATVYTMSNVHADY